MNLIDIVSTYSSFGDHHTGTSVDRETSAWLVDLLGDLGATHREETYEFERFVGEAELHVDGDPVPSLPVFYSAVGRHICDRVEVVRVPFNRCGTAHGLDDVLVGRTGGVAVAVDGPDDLAVQCNRVPLNGSRPAVVVPGNWADRVQRGASLRFDARLERSESSNIIAELGAPNHSPVTITTPLTAWTPAAGERGSGLAIALALMVELAAAHHVTLVACSGHELDHLGLRRFLAGSDVIAEWVIHLGASVGAVEPGADGTPALGRHRYVLTDAPGETRAAIAARVAGANWTLLDLDPWPGEGGTWRDAGASVLSFIGQFPYFHTAADIPAHAVTSDTLELAKTVALDAARVFLAER
ncbi:MAG TPA: hypothetical protein VES40_13565 [Ilumatobacteraceae bacterium]|nr:hypothetical protein [Ilumatobacteraceae bacterium]